MKTKDRKTQIDQVLAQAQKLIDHPAGSQHAWHRLCLELEHLAHPEARMPRFKTLLRALWTAATNEQS